ncbi:MAG: hypothetical protein N0E48_20425 [Candidatus Thiodiazotropha endolucinida]|nr:hypothetical protein [Candidatus Thiodiazotropha taylori]MCW4345699.1 hypothetical protein [Candidatus Thiodiazotropha endolucinida]
MDNLPAKSLRVNGPQGRLVNTTNCVKPSHYIVQTKKVTIFSFPYERKEEPLNSTQPMVFRERSFDFYGGLRFLEKKNSRTMFCRKKIARTKANVIVPYVKL